MRDGCPRAPDQQHSQAGMRQKPGTSRQRQQGGAGLPKYTSKRPSHLSPEGGCPIYLLPWPAAKESPWPAPAVPICHGRMAQRDPSPGPEAAGELPLARGTAVLSEDRWARRSSPICFSWLRRASEGPRDFSQPQLEASDDSPLAPVHRDERWRAPHSFPPPPPPPLHSFHLDLGGGEARLSNAAGGTDGVAQTLLVPKQWRRGHRPHQLDELGSGSV